MRTVIQCFLLLVLMPFSAAQAMDLETVKVASDVYALVGPITNRTPENLGNNATFGVVVTNDGVVLIDSGGSYLGAQRIHQAIQQITNQPIRYVINSGGQDHRWFGNSYFSELGAKIISSRAARKDHQQRLSDQIGRLTALIGDEQFKGTKEKYADILFDNDYELTLGGVKLEIHHVGQAHTPGDAYIWLADRSVMFSGDIVYVERMLGVGEQSNSKSWLRVFESMAGYKPAHVVPGHGHPVALEVAEKDTYRYLKTLREKVTAFMEDGGDASDIAEVDLGEFNYLDNYDTLSGRNALKVFTELEWE